MADTTESQPTQTPYLQRLHDSEQYWAWKFGLRVAICVLDIIGIGAAAWLTSTTFDNASVYSFGYYDDGYVFPFLLIAVGLSLVWCLICILVVLLRRPPRPVHPGVAVGIDLILWLAFIVTGLFAVAAIYTLSYFGSDHTYLEDPTSTYSYGYEGHYYLAPNDTWVYKVTSVDNSYHNGYYVGYNYTSANNISTVKRHCDQFASCAQQDAYINRLWHHKERRYGTEILTGVVQWLCVILHFVLFVWACADVHKRNSYKKLEYTQGMADKIISDMQARGLITINNTGAATGAAPAPGPVPTASGALPQQEMTQRAPVAQNPQDPDHIGVAQ